MMMMTKKTHIGHCTKTAGSSDVKVMMVVVVMMMMMMIIIVMKHLCQ